MRRCSATTPGTVPNGTVDHLLQRTRPPERGDHSTGRGTIGGHRIVPEMISRRAVNRQAVHDRGEQQVAADEMVDQLGERSSRCTASARPTVRRPRPRPGTRRRRGPERADQRSELPWQKPQQCHEPVRRGRPTHLFDQEITICRAVNTRRRTRSPWCSVWCRPGELAGV